MGVKLREKALSDGGVSFYLDISHAGKRWYQFLDIKAPASRRSEEFKKKKELAEKARSTKEYQLTVEKIGLPDETKQVQDFLAFVKERSATMRRNWPYTYLVDLLKEFTGQEELPMDKITKDFLLAFQDFLKRRNMETKKRKMAASSIYMIVHRFSTYINKAVEAGFMTDNPYQKIPRSQRVKLKRPTPDYLTVNQIELLAQKSHGIPEQLKLAFFFSCFSGLRWSDCSRLRWAQITRQKMEGQEIRILRLEQIKTEHNAYVPLSEQAIEILEQRKKQSENEHLSPYVFPELYEPDGTFSKQTINQKRIHAWGKQAGLERLYFHLARHTFATLTLSEGADLYTVSKLLGHTDIKNTMIYAHVVDRLKMQAVARLPKLSIGFTGKKNRHRKAG